MRITKRFKRIQQQEEQIKHFRKIRAEYASLYRALLLKNKDFARLMELKELMNKKSKKF